MPESVFHALILNVALLLALGLVYDVASVRWRSAQSAPRQALAGLLVGAIGLAVMNVPWPYAPGIVFDTRSVLLAISGLFFGAIPTAIAMAMTAALRIAMGGAAALAGVAVIVASGAIGLAWGHRRRERLAEIGWLELLGLGFTVHLVMLACMALLPWDTARPVLAAITLPVLTIYPLATAALGALLADRLRRERMAVGLRESEARYRQLSAGLERRVHERTAQLEAVNQELEAFAYSVSHDLRAPLRAIEGFSGIIAEDYGAQLDAEGRRLLGVVRANAQRMSRLIDDLLSFARTGRSEMKRGPAAMGELARSAFALVVEDAAARARIDFTVGELPDAEGDVALLQQVWFNLLSNAVKFSARRERPAITVSGACAGGEVEYCVRDNGAGFDAQHADKLFGVFQRLHPVDEFEGTGIGLALVQRIVARHGGRVWAHGAVGQGAAFSFALPGSGSRAGGSP